MSTLPVNLNRSSRLRPEPTVGVSLGGEEDGAGAGTGTGALCFGAMAGRGVSGILAGRLLRTRGMVAESERGVDLGFG